MIDYKNNRIDSDRDGLSDYKEINFYGTDPKNPDTDGDGVNDGDEVKMGRNPKGPGKLKDLFIPHEGNDYKPHSLHPRRLAFHGLSAVLVKVFVVAMVAIFPIEAWLTPDIQLAESRKIIQLTNEIRENLGVNILRESSLLNEAAFRKAEDMLVNQYFAHVSPSDLGLADWLRKVSYNYASAGENLAMGFANSEDVVAGWKRSKTHYANMIDPEFQEIGVGMASGSYEEEDTTFVAEYFGAPNVFMAVSPVGFEDLGNNSEEIIENENEIPENANVDQEIEFVENESMIVADKEENIDVVEGLEEVKNSASIKDTLITEFILEKPALLTPVNNYLSREEEINFSVFAPGAESLVVYIDGAQKLKFTEIENSQINFKLELREGIHDIDLKSIKGELEVYSPNYKINIDTTPPMLDISQTKIFVNEPFESDTKVVKVEAYLSADTKAAYANFEGENIFLSPSDDELNKWVGHVNIPNSEENFSPVVLASLTATDFAGNTITEDINWKNIKPSKTSLLNQYFFIKSHQSKYLAPIFSLSSWYFRLAFFVLTISLLLNIFIEIRKQHPHIIMSAVGVLGLLLVLVIF